MTGVRAVDPEDRPRHLAAAGADEPGERDDLARPHVEADVEEHALAREPVHAQHGRADRGLLLREQRAELATDHPADHLVRCHVGDPRVVHDGAVAHHRDGVTDREDLFQAVRDEQHRRALLAQRPHDVEQPLDLGARKRGGRLVHDQHARVEAERLRDLHDLLVGDRQAADRALGVEPHAEAVEQVLDAPVHRPPVDPLERAERVVAHDHVLRDAEVREQRRLLVDHRDARVARVVRGVEVDRRAVDEHLARVAADHAAEHLHERRLAGAVLAHERPDLAGPQRDVAIAKGVDGAVGLAHALEGDDRCRRLSCQLLVDLRLLPLETTEHDQNRALLVCQERIAGLFERFMIGFGSFP